MRPQIVVKYFLLTGGLIPMKKIDVNEQSISSEMYTDLGRNYFSKPSNVILRHALSKTDIPTIVSDSKNSVETLNNFSNEIKTLPVANQKGSGRCWKIGRASCRERV